jgi:hypothetical protein
MKQLTSVFSGHETTLVDMPLAEDAWSCPSVLAYGYADETITAPNSNPISIWGFPGGIRHPANDWDEGEFATCDFSGADKTNLGSIVSADGDYQGCMAAWSTVDSGMHVSSSTSNAIKFPLTVVPFQSGSVGNASETGYQARTVAFGIRVSFIGALADTEGFVEFVSPAEYLGVGPSSTLEASRGDPSFRRHFFGVDRTHTFYWTPNCDEVKYLSNFGNTKHVLVALNTRFLLRLGGLDTGDKILVEVAAIQGFTGNETSSIAIPRPVSVDSQHVINTLQIFRGQHHPHSDPAERKSEGGVDLVPLAAGIKARATPALNAISNAADFASLHWKDVAKAGSAAARAMSTVASFL